LPMSSFSLTVAWHFPMQPQESKIVKCFQPLSGDQHRIAELVSVRVQEVPNSFPKLVKELAFQHQPDCLSINQVLANTCSYHFVQSLSFIRCHSAVGHTDSAGHAFRIQN